MESSSYSGARYSAGTSLAHIDVGCAKSATWATVMSYYWPTTITMVMENQPSLVQANYTIVGFRLHRDKNPRARRVSHLESMASHDLELHVGLQFSQLGCIVHFVRKICGVRWQ